MALEDNKDAVREMIDNINERDVESTLETVSDDCFIQDGSGRQLSKDELSQFMGELLNSHPDYHLEVEDVIAEEDRVVVRLTETGTMKGAFMGIEPTGKTYTIPATNIYRLEDGVITGIWMERDIKSIEQQLGIAA